MFEIIETLIIIILVVAAIKMFIVKEKKDEK